MKKTNAVRLLDTRGIDYQLTEYEVDEHDLSAGTLAAKINQDINQVFKTLVLRGDKTGIFIVVVPGNAEVDLKKAARISGNKNAAMVQQKELLPLTGYLRGGCSPLGMKKPYPVYIHESCLMFGFIYISAGQRGLQLKLNPKDLVAITGAIMGDLAE